ncbi:hypothetical protein [Pseudogracilibacillus sp. SO30301A]|uniref:hypothetical protein n=1 Tax=Pseudogracilibacillus sp. SO30301A TaxID=3098291 RepID=UPI00300DD20C
MTTKKEKFHKKKWFAILMLLFFAPIGIILIWTNKHFEKKTNMILSVVFGVWFVFILMVGQPSEEEKAEAKARQEQLEKEREEKKLAKEEEKAQKEKEEAEKEKKEQEKADKEVKEKEEQKKQDEEAFNQAVEDWDSYKTDLLEHYGEAGVIDIQENPGSDFDVVNVYVPNEFKISSEDERRYYVEEIGPLLEEDIGAHFNNDQIWIEFKYEDGNNMATRKMFGGWKIK